MKQYLKTIVYLAAALVSVACSSGGDNDFYSFKPESYNDVVSRGNTYEGIWMVNDVKAEAADVSINFDDTEVQGDALPSTATFFGFPFKYGNVFRLSVSGDYRFSHAWSNGQQYP